MSRIVTKEEAVKHKKKAIRILGDVFETFINSSNKKHWKKADLLGYWIESFGRYLLEEESFDYTKIPRYKRGDIISVNFGFNVGSEHGGKHYAVVLDNDNKQSSRVITVIPLSSGVVENTHDRDVYLGNELYDKLIAKYNRLDEENRTASTEITETLKVLREAIGEKQIDNELPKLVKKYEERAEIVNEQRKELNKFLDEISRLKNGSRAMMEQITTISKMRIYKPKTSKDLLYGIKLSDGAMDKINIRLRELYIYE